MNLADESYKNFAKGLENHELKVLLKYISTEDLCRELERRGVYNRERLIAIEKILNVGNEDLL